MDILYDAVKNIIIYLILITVIMNLMGDSSFKKYVGIFTGMVLIIIVILPVMKLFNMSDKLTYYLDVNNFKVKANDISNELAQAEDSQNEEILLSYQNSLKEEITTRLSIHGVVPKYIDIIIEEDPSSIECGTVKSIHIRAEEKIPEEEANKSKSEIDEVVIDKITINKEKKIEDEEQIQDSEKKNLDSLLELNIKQELASFFNLELEYITLEISD